MTSAQLAVAPIVQDPSLKEKIYDSLKTGIMSMDIYAEDADLRVDERRLSDQMNISRTPIREALARLEQEGLVRIVPRRGVFIVRKTKAEVLDMITVWAALESMAARLVTEKASDDEIRSLRSLFRTFGDGRVDSRIDEYSDANIRFHSRILELSQCALLARMTDNVFMHVRAIRVRTIGEGDRASRSIVDHMHIIEALEARDTDRAERLVREHTLNLLRHVERNLDLG